MVDLALGTPHPNTTAATAATTAAAAAATAATTTLLRTLEGLRRPAGRLCAETLSREFGFGLP